MNDSERVTDFLVVMERRKSRARDGSRSSDPSSSALSTQYLIFIPLYKNKMFCVVIFLKGIKKKAPQKKVQRFKRLKKSDHPCS